MKCLDMDKTIRQWDGSPVPLSLSYDENGVSIGQIVRLCGESKGMVEKCLK